ncbi:MnhB domain-containing protein [Pseudonocardia sp. RS010]|uniref:MnhB domain-containing protein n=1 Tax=Pseudonocardia sp. RS010 TaxID=3385979 RepID=UPI0039A0A0B3
MSAPEKEQVPFEDWDEPKNEWMLPGSCPVRANRTLLLEAAARFLFPTVLVFSGYLLFVGHYGPGGGFSGGLVAGLAFVLRYIAGGATEGAGIGARVRVRPPLVVGSGLLLALVTALVPIAFGAAPLTSAHVVLHVPVVGEVDLVSSLALDVGVYVLIVGVVLELLRSLGTGIERDAREDPR